MNHREVPTCDLPREIHLCSIENALSVYRRACANGEDEMSSRSAAVTWLIGHEPAITSSDALTILLAAIALIPDTKSS